MNKLVQLCSTLASLCWHCLQHSARFATFLVRLGERVVCQISYFSKNNKLKLKQLQSNFDSATLKPELMFIWCRCLKVKTCILSWLPVHAWNYGNLNFVSESDFLKTETFVNRDNSPFITWVSKKNQIISF